MDRIPCLCLRTTSQISSPIHAGMHLETSQPREQLIHMNESSRSGQKVDVVAVGFFLKRGEKVQEP